MAKFSESAQMERRGITHIAAKCGELGHIWRETPNSDVGFDGEIELVTGGIATGQIVKVQVRAGSSYLRNERPDRFDYYGDANELEYWWGATNPVVLIVFDPRNDTAFYMDIKNYIRVHSEVLTQRPHKIVFMKQQQSKPLSTEGLELLFGPDYDELASQYMQHVTERFSKLTIYSVNSDSPLAVDLERVFIRLRATRHSNWFTTHLWREHAAAYWPKVLATFRSKKTKPHKGALGEAVFMTQASSQHYLSIPDVERITTSVERITTGVERITIGEALGEKLNTVIIGSPGAGKTTLLKYLALTFARKRMKEQLGLTESLLPLFVTLRDFSRFLDNSAQRGELLDLGPKLLPEFITAHLTSVAPHLKIPEEFFRHYLDSSKCILLLDGLDEVADPLKRVRVAEAIDAFTRQFRGNRFVVTSRPRGYEGEARQRLSGLYADWTIQDFDDDDMKKFTGCWYEAVTRDRLGNSAEAIAEASSKADDLLRAIRADRRVMALAHNPLLLSVLAMVHQRGVGLPQRRAELYDECTDLLLGYWDQTKGGEAARELVQYGELDRNEKRTLLEPIALWFHERGQNDLEADKKELQEKIAEQFLESFVDKDRVAHKRAELFLRVIDERAGLLVEREVNVYSFAHLTFQEYLAARSIADSDNYVEYTLQRIHDDWWREVILLEIGHLSDVRHFGRRGRKLTTDLIRTIRAAGSPLESILRRDFFFVARAMADIGPLGVDDEIRHDIFKELIELWQTTPFEPQQREAVDILGYSLPTIEGPRIRTAIISLLDHQDPEKMILAMKAIVQIGKVLLDDDVTTRLFALSHHSSAVVRATAAGCIEKLRGPSLYKAVATRMLALTEDFDPVVRRTAASLLLPLGKEGMRTEIVDVLFRLSTDEDRGVRDVAVSALARISRTRSKQKIERKIVELTKHTQPEVRASGALALGQLAKIKATADLVKRLLSLISDGAEDVRSVALGLFDEIGSSPTRKDLIDRLLELSADKDKVVRDSATTVLRNLEIQTFVPGPIPKDTQHTTQMAMYIAKRLTSTSELSESEAQFLFFSVDRDPNVRLKGIALIDGSTSEKWNTQAHPLFLNVNDYLEGGVIYKTQEEIELTQPNSGESSKQVEARLQQLLSDEDTTVRLKAAIAYRARLNAPYDNAALELLVQFWTEQVGSSEKVSGVEGYNRTSDIGYEELKLLARLLPKTN